MDPGASLPRSPAPSAACSGGRGLGGTRSRAGFHQTVRLPRTPPASHRLSCGRPGHAEMAHLFSSSVRPGHRKPLPAPNKNAER